MNIGLRFARLTKRIVQMLPKSWRQAVKRVSYLEYLYKMRVTRAVSRQKSVEEFYPNIISAQRQFIESLIRKVEDVNVQVIVVAHKLDDELLLQTLESLNTREVALSKCLIWTESNDLQLKNYEHLTELPKLERYRHSALSNLKTLLINQGDTINSWAWKVIADYTDFEITYFDQESLDPKTGQPEPLLFPDWDPDLQINSGYIYSGVVCNSLVALKVLTNVELRYDSISRWVTRLYVERGSKIQLKHIPLILGRINKGFWVKKDYSKNFNEQLINRLQTAKPLVSIIIPTFNAEQLVRKCINSILTKTTYDNFEIILVDNNSDNKSALRYFESLAENTKVKVLRYPKEFNFSAINNFAVTQASGSIIAFVNNDIEVINSAWLENMAANVLRDDIGCVGAKLLYPNNKIQHAGVTMGLGGGASHAHKYFYKDEDGYLRRLGVSNRFSAVTAACLLIKKKDFIDVEGFDEDYFKVAFNDVDLCLKVKQLNKANLYCANAILYHHESVSRGTDSHGENKARFENEVLNLQSKWASVIKDDACYNLFLTRKSEDFGVTGSINSLLEPLQDRMNYNG